MDVEPPFTFFFLSPFSCILQEDVSLAKEEWELSRLKALKEEEERRAELEEDEMLFTYSREDAQNQVKSPRKHHLNNKQRPRRPLKQAEPMPMGLMDKYERQVWHTEQERGGLMGRRRGMRRGSRGVHRVCRGLRREAASGVDVRTSEKSRGVVVVVDSGGEEFTEPVKHSSSTTDATSLPEQGITGVKRGSGRGRGRGRGSPRKGRGGVQRLGTGANVGAVKNSVGSVSPGKLNPAIQSPWSNPNLVIRTRKASVAGPDSVRESECENGEIDVVNIPAVSSRNVTPLLSKLTSKLPTVTQDRGHAACSVTTKVVSGAGSTPVVSYVKNIQGPSVSLSGLRNIQLNAGNVSAKLNSVPFNSLRTVVNNNTQGTVRAASHQQTTAKTVRNTVPILEKMAMQLGSAVKPSPVMPARSLVSSLPPPKPQLVQSRASFAQVVQKAPVAGRPSVSNVSIPTPSVRPSATLVQPSTPRTSQPATHAIQIGNQIIRLQNLSSSPNQIIQLRSNTGQQHFIQIRQVLPTGGGQPQTVLVNRPTQQAGVVMGRPVVNSTGVARPVVNTTSVPRPIINSAGIARPVANSGGLSRPLVNSVVVPRAVNSTVLSRQVLLTQPKAVVQQPNVVRLQQAGPGSHDLTQNRLKLAVTSSSDIICIE